MSGFVDVETTGKAEFGASFSPVLKGIKYASPVEVEAYHFIDPTTRSIGRGIEIRLLAIAVGGEASVGWGRGMREFEADATSSIKEFPGNVESSV